MLPPLNRHALKKAARSKRLRCPAHLKWVRSHMCCVPNCRAVPIEAAHVRLGTHTGLGRKPDDSRAISLCVEHHGEAHRGEASFQAKHKIDMLALADEFAAKSPHRQKLTDRARLTAGARR